jgi:hypothetical protein
LVITACGVLPDVTVWLKKVDFEVDPNANNGTPFSCHIVVAYSKDLYDKLQGMDAQGYFSNAMSLEKTYRDAIEVFKYDMIPGKNKLSQPINLRSYTKAKGAFLFAKYLSPGKFTENVGKAKNMVVRFLPYKMEIHSDISFESLGKLG